MKKRTLLLAVLGLTFTLTVFAGTRSLADNHAGEWQTLFNGEDLTGWQPVGGHMEDWKVVDGEIHITDRGDGAATWIATEKQYSNYELSVDFKIYEGGNSGIFLRAPITSNPAYEGMEIQLLDDYAEKHAELED